MKKINIVAGGPLECLPVLKRQSNQEIWIAVDRGLEHLIEYEINPDYVIGDFDSVQAITKKNIDPKIVFQFPKEKDETDLDLALTYAISKNPKEITIYGATGGRLDHELVNLQLLSKGLNNAIETFIVDKKNRISLKKSGSYLLQSSPYKYVSFISYLDQVEELTLEGFKYNLNSASLKNGSSLCISNELILKKGTYSFSAGILIVIESND